MAGCGKDITIFVPRGYDYKEIPFKCGNTGLHGSPEFCPECEEIHAGRDWRKEAEENGEQWEDDY